MISRLIAMIILYLASSSLALQPDGCKTKNNSITPITKITYSTTGGRGGNYESLEISQDSLLYVQARRGNEKTTKEKTAKKFWNEITDKIKLQNFSRIKSNPGHALYDGIDITIMIETAKEKLTIVNGNEDTLNYKKIQPFTDLLQKKLEELRTKIVW